MKLGARWDEAVAQVRAAAERLAQQQAELTAALQRLAEATRDAAIAMEQLGEQLRQNPELSRDEEGE